MFTEYEMKFMEKGQNIYRCEVVIGPEALRKHRAAKHEKSLQEEAEALASAADASEDDN